ncbi:DIRP domain-containing protein [Aphelenchoides fujianensis]|nr:DIRP domain-containing protein [Aphelenchoides fujianensis]
MLLRASTAQQPRPPVRQVRGAAGARVAAQVAPQSQPPVDHFAERSGRTTAAAPPAPPSVPRPAFKSTRVYVTGSNDPRSAANSQFESSAVVLPPDELTLPDERHYVPRTVQLPPPPRPSGIPHGTELSYALKQNLRNLKNILKLPKARTFVFCEFFYSAVDRQLFLEENEFTQLIQDSFPNLKTMRMRLPEWREVRRLIGKPRRLSQCLTLAADHDLPKKLPRQPVVGMKVYARIRTPKDGIYAGTIDAIHTDGYRVTFEKEEMIPGMFDTEVMTEMPLELLSISYFIEMNNATSRTAAAGGGMYGKTAFVVDPPQAAAARDEKIGNFPLRMLVIMVKLFKVLEHKKILIQNLTWLNDEGEKMQMMTQMYPSAFQERYAEILRELEAVNRLLESYMNGIEEYNDLLVTNLAAPQPTDKPDQLRKTTNAHATQLVKHCNATLNIRQLGVERKHHVHYELSILAETLNQMKAEISPNNVGCFQDCVEVHLKQVYLMNRSKTS